MNKNIMIGALTLSAFLSVSDASALPSKLDNMEKRTIFITSAQFNGNLGGTAGADAKCNEAAAHPDALVPSGTYKALIADEQQAWADVLPTENVLYMSAMNEPTTTAFHLLHGRGAFSSLGLNEFGAYQSISQAWTGYTPTNDSFINSKNCANWTSDKGWSAPLFDEGATFDYPGYYITSSLDVCESQHSLICVQQ
ncbi:DUF1554 domain-containing protein [Aestuariibacter sp. AA17]|uniref:DUF1554 domain-containing protein n=1 Tax=Fluctibacter corallii TaxID=2984329 RepID=A0ABT3A4N2_9ALTE|nr:DUF1554 domain-containing protein [Aestuariibacter sp. AA17]MCV2883634.1 DUF1554 domain-containing protein [Aestuariibacter sp. AA17]